jgi:regulatory protein
MSKDNEITAIKVNVKNRKRRSIFIDGEFALSVSEGVLFQNHLKVGGTISPEAVTSLKSEEETHQILQAAYRLLSYRPRSVKEMRDRLLEKEWSKDQVTSVIAKLEGDGYLNDLDFARMFARDRVKSKYLGPAGLRNELFRKGIDQELIALIVDEIYTEHPPAKIIEALMRKRGIEPESEIDPKEKKRFINQLKRKGFSWGEMEALVTGLKTSSGK